VEARGRQDSPVPVTVTHALTIASYYRSPDVRARMAEYCGGRPDEPEAFAAWSIAGYGGRRGLHEQDGAPVAVGNSMWATLLDDGADVCRSLADRNGALLQLDVDYTNPADRGEAYRDPATCFARVEAVYRAVGGIFAGFGIGPLVLMTGRGYHFTLRAPTGSRFHSDLVGLGSPPASLCRRYEALASPAGAPAMGRAHDGAGRLLEHLGHEVLRRLEGRSPIPVTLGDVAPPGGGPFVCLDLTAYADPLFVRYGRCAFSANQKASVAGLAPSRPFVLALPREAGAGIDDLLRDREDPDRAASRARFAQARIPDVPDGGGWVEEYARGALARFHRAFDAGPEVPRECWPHSYDTLELATLPACVRPALASPNPALLTPVHLRTAALALWGLGWHPRSVAALVRSRYEKDCGWGDLWRRYEHAARAEFYVRLFCGALADGLEDPGSFTCVSQALRGLCPGGDCGWDLGPLLPSVVRRWREAGGRGPQPEDET
jgi:hypothetical protein